MQYVLTYVDLPTRRSPINSARGPPLVNGLPILTKTADPIDPEMAINWRCLILRPLFGKGAVDVSACDEMPQSPKGPPYLWAS
jgi:hypothetical protein